jgi:hypothetical protein
VPEPYKPNRKGLIFAACLCACASILLFIFRPIPPVGLVAAVELAFLAAIFLYSAFFPQHVDRIRLRAERALEKKPSDHLGRWVP